MNKINLIIAREYMTKIKSRTFILLTILGPVLYIAVIFGSVLLATAAEKDEMELIVSDKSGKFKDVFEKQSKFVVHFSDMGEDEIEDEFQKENIKSPVVFIPDDVVETKSGMKLYYKESPGIGAIDKLKDIVSAELQDMEMQAAGIDKELTSKIQNIRVGMKSIEMGEGGGKVGSAAAASILAFGSAFLLYIFIFFYGSMVMRGVQEEKTSRISEVIISSVKPFELMMGKIIGNALLGFTQFVIWIILASAGTSVVGAMMPDKVQGLAESMAQQQLQGNEQAQMAAATEINPQEVLMNAAIDFNIFETVGFFVIFFLGGYLLYASLFAAIAAAVDGQQDLQQFMLPVSIPLILGIIVMPSVLENPNNGVAVTFSLIPFTSPIVMMARIPFGVVWWQKLLSVVILIVTFMGSVYVSGKIYRVGLLSYGSKPSWKQMLKWLTYKT